MRWRWGLFFLAGLVTGCQNEPAPVAPTPSAVSAPLAAPSPSAVNLSAFAAPAFIRSSDSTRVSVAIGNDGPEDFSGRLHWRTRLDDDELDASGCEITVSSGRQAEAAWTVHAPEAGILYCEYRLESDDLPQLPAALGRIAVLPASTRHQQEFSGYLPKEASESRFLTLTLPENVAAETVRLHVSLRPERSNRPESPHPSELELKLDGGLLGQVAYHPFDPHVPGEASYPLTGEPGPHSLELKRLGTQSCAYLLTLEYFERPEADSVKAATEIRLERAYYLLEELPEALPAVATVSWQNRLYRRIPLKNLNSVPPGALLEASISVQAPESWTARALTDPIPGGCRNLENALDPVQYRIRLDGTHSARKVFSHLFQAEFPGSYHIPPATLQLSEQETILSDSDRLLVEPAQ